MKNMSEREFKQYQPSIYFLIARLIMVVSIPLEGLKSYGDFWNFYLIADAGRPFLDLWVEFPPVFPILSRGVYLLVGGREHSFIYALIIIFSIFQAASIFLFQRIAQSYSPKNDALEMTIVYAFLQLGLFYGWAYFDSLAVFFLLQSLYLLILHKSRDTGMLVGMGGLIKWFPLLLLPAAWKWLGSKKALATVLIALLVMGMGWGILFAVSPEYTQASVVAQGAKGSWETIWALIDGNLTTGNFSSEIKRTIPASASLSTGNPSIVSSWLTLLILGGVGFLVFWKATLDSSVKLIGFSGFTLIMFFLWAPGYSPQWTLYLLPLVILSFDKSKGRLISLLLILINLLEWPILLSRGWFHFLEEIILLRTAVFVLLAILFGQVALQNSGNKEAKE